jgi:hypothetical protein
VFQADGARGVGRYWSLFRYFVIGRWIITLIRTAS